MRIAVLGERASGETRVAASPETVKKFTALGATVAIEQGCGLCSSVSDAEFAAAGAEVAPLAAAVNGADTVSYTHLTLPTKRIV